jgi:transcriptional regulator with XRE-family HTH domain
MDTTKEHPGGRILARYRNQRGIGQQDLAEMAHCSRSMIAQIETGDRLPSSELLSTMSNALDLDTIERAMLFYLYGKVERNQTNMLPYVIAVLYLDLSLQPDQVDTLVQLVTQAYQNALRANGEQVGYTS